MPSSHLLPRNLLRHSRPNLVCPSQRHHRHSQPNLVHPSRLNSCRMPSSHLLPLNLLRHSRPNLDRPSQQHHRHSQPNLDHPSRQNPWPSHLNSCRMPSSHLLPRNLLRHSRSSLVRPSRYHHRHSQPRLVRLHQHGAAGR